MSGIHAALAGIGSVLSLPGDWWALYKAEPLALGTATRVWPDSSGNGRNTDSASITITDAQIGAFRTLGNSGFISRPYTSTGPTTFVVVHRASATSNEVIRLAAGGTTPFSLRASGGFSTATTLGQSNTNGNGNAPAGGVASVMIFRWPGSAAAVGVPWDVRANGAVVNSGLTTVTSAVVPVEVSVTGSGGSNRIPRWGWFDRRLSDDEVVAVEADIRAFYGI